MIEQMRLMQQHTLDKEYRDREGRLAREEKEYQLFRDRETKMIQLRLDMARKPEGKDRKWK